MRENDVGRISKKCAIELIARDYEQIRKYTIHIHV